MCLKLWLVISEDTQVGEKQVHVDWGYSRTCWFCQTWTCWFMVNKDILIGGEQGHVGSGKQGHVDWG